jgi:hypothetical protein
VDKAVEFVKSKTMEMIQGKMSLSQLTITKSLSKYKADWVRDDIKQLEEKMKSAKGDELTKLRIQLNRKQDDLKKAPPYPAHKILADRMAARDAGNAPAVGERMGYVYVMPPAGKPVPELQGDRIETPDYIRQTKLEPDYQYYIEHQLMKPLGQLFGLMVERIEGCPYTSSIKDDMRESVAIDLLFGNALNTCKKQSNLDAFLQPKTTLRRSPRNHKAKETTTASTAPKQATLNSYFTHKMMIDQYESEKKKAKQSLKEKKGNPNS